MKKWAEQFYKGKAWKKCRQAYIDERMLIDGGICEECHKEPGYIVHHKVRLNPYNITNADVSLNHALLSFVCKKCHDREEEHAFIKQKKLLCSFDENGQPTPTPPKREDAF